MVLQQFLDHRDRRTHRSYVGTYAASQGACLVLQHWGRWQTHWRRCQTTHTPEAAVVGLAAHGPHAVELAMGLKGACWCWVGSPCCKKDRESCCCCGLKVLVRVWKQEPSVARRVTLPTFIRNIKKRVHPHRVFTRSDFQRPKCQNVSKTISIMNNNFL